MESDTGLSFLASQQNGLVTATSLPRIMSRNGTALAARGIEAIEVLRFVLDPKAGRYHSVFGIDFLAYDAIQTDQRTRDYQTCEGRILDNRENQSGTALVKFDGTSTFNEEQPVALGCRPALITDNANTGGTLILRYGKTRRELIVYEEGMGSTVTATSDDGVVFRADNAECELADSGVVELGVTRRWFESFTLDFGAKTWTYASVTHRNDVHGVSQIQCISARTTITGELPNAE